MTQLLSLLWQIHHTLAFGLFFIDEANKMSNLTKTEEGRHVLNFSPNVRNRIEVVLASSDSFWLSQYNRERHLLLETSLKRKLWNSGKSMLLLNAILPPPSFDRGSGENILMLKKYVAEYCQMEGKLPREIFSAVASEGNSKCLREWLTFCQKMWLIRWLKPNSYTWGNCEACVWSKRSYTSSNIDSSSSNEDDCTKTVNMLENCTVGHEQLLGRE